MPSAAPITAEGLYGHAPPALAEGPGVASGSGLRASKKSDAAPSSHRASLGRSSHGGGGGGGGASGGSSDHGLHPRNDRFKEKNRLAQQRFRAKQKDRMESMKERMAELEAESDTHRRHLAAMVQENKLLRSIVQEQGAVLRQHGIHTTSALPLGLGLLADEAQHASAAQAAAAAAVAAATAAAAAAAPTTAAGEGSGAGQLALVAAATGSAGGGGDEDAEMAGGGESDVGDGGDGQGSRDGGSGDGSEGGANSEGAAE